MRAVNFSAGPCTLPLSVLEEARAEFLEFGKSGMSLIEMSHRSPAYGEVHEDARALAASVFGMPDDFEVLLLQGGATLQFAMVPMNLLQPGAAGGYVESGSWAKKALADGAHHGELYRAWSGEDGGYTAMPLQGEVEVREATRYLHVTSNETIGGIRMTQWPNVGPPLVADMSSDYLSRTIPWDRFDLIYGGAQKNLGPAGVTLVFVRRAALADTNEQLASYLRYPVHAEARSLHNTPPVFSIWMMGKVLAWMEDQGGLAEMERLAATRSSMIYETIDESDGFYRSPVSTPDRSHMNVVFRLPSEDLEARFIAGAESEDMVGLKGHRSVGGIRASMYNAMPVEGVAALVTFMHEFRAAAE